VASLDAYVCASTVPPRRPLERSQPIFRETEYDVTHGLFVEQPRATAVVEDKGSQCPLDDSCLGSVHMGTVSMLSISVRRKLRR
jgi:hypothetical protein